MRTFSDRQGQRRAGASSANDGPGSTVGRTSSGQGGAAGGGVRAAGPAGRPSGRDTQSRSSAATSFSGSRRGRTSGGVQVLPSRSRSGAGATRSTGRVATSGSRARTTTSSRSSGAEGRGARNSGLAWRRFGNSGGISTRGTGSWSPPSGRPSSPASRGAPRVDSGRASDSTSPRAFGSSQPRSGRGVAPSRSRTSRSRISGATSGSGSLDWRRFGGGNRSGSLGRSGATGSSRRGTTSGNAALRPSSPSSRSFGRTPEGSRSADRRGAFFPRSHSRMTGNRGAGETTSSAGSRSSRSPGGSSPRIGPTSSRGLRLRGRSSSSGSSSGRGASRNPPADFRGFRNRDGSGYAVPSRSHAPAYQGSRSRSSRGSGSTSPGSGVSRGNRAPSATRSPARSGGSSPSRPRGAAAPSLAAAAVRSLAAEAVPFREEAPSLGAARYLVGAGPAGVAGAAKPNFSPRPPWMRPKARRPRLAATVRLHRPACCVQVAAQD